MTTKVHVVNFGPDVVEVQPIVEKIGDTSQPATKLYPQSSCDFYVYDGNAIVVQEEKKEKLGE
jgi:hypothetical protein